MKTHLQELFLLLFLLLKHWKQEFSFPHLLIQKVMLPGLPETCLSSWSSKYKKTELNFRLFCDIKLTTKQPKKLSTSKYNLKPTKPSLGCVLSESVFFILNVGVVFLRKPSLSPKMWQVPQHLVLSSIRGLFTLYCNCLVTGLFCTKM